MNEKIITKQQFIVGIILGLLGSLCFSAKAVFVKMAYAEGITALPLLTLRMLFATPFFIALLLWKRHSPSVMSKKEMLIITLFGLMGYYLSSLFDFLGLAYISVGLERLTLFLYPSFVMFFSAIFLSRKIKMSDIRSLVLCYAGIALAFYSEVHLSATPLQTIWGTALVATSAVCYAIYLIGNGIYGKKLGSVRFTSYVMLSSTVGIIIHSALTSSISGLFIYSEKVYMIALLMAILSTVLASVMITIGINIIGPSLISITGTMSPIFTLLFGALLLHEPLSGLQIIGMLLVIAGIVTVKKEEAC